MVTSSKHREIRERLESAILSGELPPGEQLPAEHTLAQKYGVSYMTARRAVSELVSSDLVERRGRKGTFVRHTTRSIQKEVTLNLVTSAYEGSFQAAFLQHGIIEAGRSHWNANIIRLTEGQQDSLVRGLNRGEYAIILLDQVEENSALGLALQNAVTRTVSLYPDLSDRGITTIQTNLRMEIGQASERLRAAGHRQIAIVSPVPGDDRPRSSIQWESDVLDLMGELEDEVSIIKIRTPLHHPPIKQAYEAVSEYLAQGGNATALITRSDSLAIGALAACRDGGRAVPDKMSLINVGDSPLMEFCTPGVTCIDVDFGYQVRLALEKLAGFRSGHDQPGGLFIHPLRLVERDSVAVRRDRAGE